MRRLCFGDFASRCALRHSLLAFILVLAASAAHAGELKLNGSVTSTLVEILAGTTLSGTGTLGGDVTVAGVHAPGNSFLDVLPGASFGVQQVGSDVSLTLVATVPEPSTLVLMAIGTGLAGWAARRRTRAGVHLPL